ncbi:hypothetical protein BJF82_13530 [Kytococcus sp. CUA-901]|nr:hypothetical protein BJF82_13530 [Kytococcus sp. CUA-901]
MRRVAMVSLHTSPLLRPGTARGGLNVYVVETAAELARRGVEVDIFTRATDVEAARAFVRWLWIDQTDKQLDFATAYGFHVPSRTSLIPEADVLASGPAADAAGYVTEYGHAQTPLLWTPRSATAWSDMMSRIVRDGADPQEELEALVPIVEDELERVTA